MSPRVILAALGCYFATMTATVLGLSQADSRSLDVVRAYGGGRFAEMHFVQLRSALPSILGGLRVAAPAAVLGAILGGNSAAAALWLGTYLLDRSAAPIRRGCGDRADGDADRGVGLCDLRHHRRARDRAPRAR